MLLSTPRSLEMEAGCLSDVSRRILEVLEREASTTSIRADNGRRKKAFDEFPWSATTCRSGCAKFCRWNDRNTSGTRLTSYAQNLARADVRSQITGLPPANA
jgi:hypothetical protein